jgi:hypothetical protein
MTCARNRRGPGVVIVFLGLMLESGSSRAQDGAAKSVSIGVILGDPIGATVKIGVSATSAYDVSIGSDYFGSPRLQIDRVWQFDTFHSAAVKTYAGPGLAIVFGKGNSPFFSKEPGNESFANAEDRKSGFGGRVILGLNLARRDSRSGFFVEAGPLLGFNHFHDLDWDAAIGFRYRLSR